MQNHEEQIVVDQKYKEESQGISIIMTIKTNIQTIPIQWLDISAHPWNITIGVPTYVTFTVTHLCEWEEKT